MTWKFRFVLHKAYFDKGYNLTSYAKFVIALVGISTLDVKLTLILGVAYAFVCYFLGRAWINYKFYEEEIEVGNTFNKFVQEMRRKLKKRNI